MDKLLNILCEIDDEIDFEHEMALVDNGLLDSLQLMRIIAALNNAFSIRINAGEIEPENFNSAKAMMALVESCMEKR
jgi:D-alanine--poly(phosphoribitol) ligase subunit 2